MNEFPTIEKNIPIPHPRSVVRGSKQEFLSKMEIGDSFRVEDERERQTWVTHQGHVRLISRKLNNGGIRIWRTA